MKIKKKHTLKSIAIDMGVSVATVSSVTTQKKQVKLDCEFRDRESSLKKDFSK